MHIFFKPVKDISGFNPKMLHSFSIRTYNRPKH